jgi:hypothetical protein
MWKDGEGDWRIYFLLLVSLSEILKFLLLRLGVYLRLDILFFQAGRPEIGMGPFWAFFILLSQRFTNEDTSGDLYRILQEFEEFSRGVEITDVFHVPPYSHRYAINASLRIFVSRISWKRCFDFEFFDLNHLITYYRASLRNIRKYPHNHALVSNQTIKIRRPATQLPIYNKIS